MRKIKLLFYSINKQAVGVFRVVFLDDALLSGPYS